ncbi:tRNA (cytosine(38)-C(5))-methyltransferase isoform X12 [Seriola lalandi dorsalis]|uniref:tRNA (cytosine(38)-C(5))-methyltransferase n=1 Tax=Seriola lalandi dorsalis TaxID=1841481 RepID=A0A3B4X646_SERLL|nr:tRNA (cytosine(38)-C(5))-methyltransferase isoform X12 [Seriola lalandi dorsalis]XP_056221051.1 tRNA (cytosine(38)-C(5))-methyltransferase isoform X8 [Seriola aureovittata]
MECVRVLELYSGIGGMHYALKESGIPGHVVAAIDINTTANQIYRHNFPDTPLWNKTIEGIALDDFNKLSFDMILMSPPCQPFTRIGLQGDISDPRTKSFLYVLDLLPRLHRLPRFILLENVKGFESSAARELLVKTLTGCGYSFQEFMVSPTSVGIPNSRLRYFLIAKMSTSFSTQARSELPDVFPHFAEADSSEQPTVLSPTCPGSCQSEEEVREGQVLYKLETAADAQRKRSQNQDLSIRQIQDFLEPQREGDLEQHLLPPRTLLRYALLLDIVQPTCRRSVCFTKGYGRYVEGTGSVLQGCTETQMESVFAGLDQVSEEEKVQQLLKLKLRYFTPREVANLMGFPQSFMFPEGVSTLQQYRTLGNSLNVVVVSRLLQLLVS